MIDENSNPGVGYDRGMIQCRGDSNGDADRPKIDCATFAL